MWHASIGPPAAPANGDSCADTWMEDSLLQPACLAGAQDASLPAQCANTLQDSLGATGQGTMIAACQAADQLASEATACSPAQQRIRGPKMSVLPPPV